MTTSLPPILSRVLSATASAILLATPTLAADPAAARSRVNPAFAPTPVRAVDWSGAYLGVHGGVIQRGFKSSNATPNIPALNFSGRRNVQSLSGGAFGVQAGYSFQSGRIVYGLEAETTLGTGNRKKSTTRLTAEQNARHALKARLGYSFGSTLVYATTGVALTQTRLQSPAVGLTPAGRKNISQTGVLVGLGVEQKLTEQIAVKGEVDYASFGQKRVQLPSGSTKVNSGLFTAKVGLNYHF